MPVIKSEFFLALNQVATERGIAPEDVLDSIRAAVLAAYKKDYGTEEDEENEDLHVKLNQESGEMHIYEKDKDITPPGFGRIAAQTARQVILQQIREAEKRTVVAHYSDQVGTIAKGRVIRFDGRNVLLDIGKAEGVLPMEEQIRSEKYHLNDQITVLIKEIREDAYGNSKIVLSRAHSDLVTQLFFKEVPEIESGTVEVKGIVREPGERTKISVYSDQSGVDPVGACVGQKGIRVKSVTDELGGAEKIDIIQYNSDDAMYIREALSPAEVESIDLDVDAKRATVSVDAEQAPLAIGRNGVNVNLASKLTGYEIDIEQVGGDKDDSNDGDENEKDEVEEKVENVEESSVHEEETKNESDDEDDNHKDDDDEKEDDEDDNDDDEEDNDKKSS